MEVRWQCLTVRVKPGRDDDHQEERFQALTGFLITPVLTFDDGGRTFALPEFVLSLETQQPGPYDHAPFPRSWP